MGVVCAKGCSSSDRPAIGHRRNNALSPTKNHIDDLSVILDCFCVPLNRLLPQSSALDGPGASCRSVVVTSINIEKQQTKRRVLKSAAIYTPVLQWFGIDVQQQVPKLLPMSLWPGSYTVFGFYNPEISDSCSVKLIGKVGSKQICLQEQMDQQRCLASEEWTELSKTLEKELQRVHVFSPKQKRSYESVQFKEFEHVEPTIIDIEEKEQRDSLDTGYLSTKRSFEHSALSVHYVGNTSDSEDGSVPKDSLVAERRQRMRRKDTPAHNLHHMRFSPLTQEFQACPLNEETESILSSGDETPLLKPQTPSKGKTSSQEGIDHEPDLGFGGKDDEPLPVKCSTPQQDMQNQSPNGKGNRDKTPTSRKKKRSIISKLGGATANDDLNIFDQKVTCRGEESDISAYADDEEDPSCAETFKTEKSLPVDKSVVQDEDQGRLDTEDVDTTDTNTAADTTGISKGEMVAEATLQKTVDRDIDLDDEVSGSSPRQKANDRNFSRNEIIEEQNISSLDNEERKSGSRQRQSSDDDSDTVENVSGDAETVEDNYRKSPNRGVDTKEEKASMKSERSGTKAFTEPFHRPRSRTFSRKMPDKSKGRSRPSKSVTNIVIREDNKGKGACVEDDSVKCNNKDHFNIPEPPLTPKEAFSDQQL